MPTYIYRCPICGEEKEIIHKMDENPLLICNNCQEVKTEEYVMKKTIQPVNFRIGGYFTSKTGYSKNSEYMKAVERKKKVERKKNG